MKRCLDSARLLCLHRRSSFRPSFATARTPSPAAARSSWRLQCTRQSSLHVEPRIVDRQVFEEFIRLKPQQCPVSRSKERDPGIWISLLGRYLQPSVRRSSGDAATPSVHGGSSEMTRELFVQSVKLANLLFHARKKADLDLLAHRGFKLNDWPAVYVLFNRLLDAAEKLRDVSLPPQKGSIGDWASGSHLSLDQLTAQGVSSPPLSSQVSTELLVPKLATLDALTERPFAQYYCASIMAEVWQGLGSIVLDAADASPNESKLAMSYVYRILARIHHSGIVSDRVYKYITPSSYQATFRPPGMQLLSPRIMDVLSDAAWLEHEAEVAAKAAATGKESPFFPVNWGIKELGHEIWLEFILWCCVEHGHIKEGSQLVDQMKTRTGDMAWNFQSWKPYLRDEESIRNTRIDREVSWRRPDSVDTMPNPRKRNGPPLPFHGLGKRTISVEVVTALLDNLPNLSYLGMGSKGLPADALLHHISVLKFAIAPKISESKFLPTSKATNWFTTRVIESGTLIPEVDPRTFDSFLRVTPCVVPPWSSDMCPVDEHSLAQLLPSQLYDDTSAFAGLIEYNLRNLSRQRLCGDALETFSMLQTIIDTSKIRRVDEFFSSRMEQPSEGTGSLPSLRPFDSSIPQLSCVTLADLLDLVTISRAFAFGEWLLFSDDIDGPTVSPNAYGNQALAPSILRFAGATKNNALGEAVIQSLTGPISLNTHRAIMNFRISMHQWGFVVPMLRFIRDHRAKSWAHSNITAIAAEIIRLDHALHHQQHNPASTTTTSDIESDLTHAKDILYRILFREFHESPYRKPNDPYFQDRVIAGMVRLFCYISSPSLHKIVGAVSSNRSIPFTRFPYIPPTAFHLIIAAIAETQGSAAARSIYKRVCVTAASPESRHLEKGGIRRFYLSRKRYMTEGDPHFDARYSRELEKKMVLPNPNTVRVIVQAAAREYEAATTSLKKGLGMINPYSSVPETALQTEPPPGSPRKHFPSLEALQEASESLIFCCKRFEVFGMSDHEIALEVGEDIYLNFQADQMKGKRVPFRYSPEDVGTKEESEERGLGDGGKDIRSNEHSHRNKDIKSLEPMKETKEQEPIWKFFKNRDLRRTNLKGKYIESKRPTKKSKAQTLGDKDNDNESKEPTTQGSKERESIWKIYKERSLKRTRDRSKEHEQEPRWKFFKERSLRAKRRAKAEDKQSQEK
ncbi:hypothetical protein BDW59DRAFT_144553 [Aspergillus cavernicola]|uniref:Uncharacterized protein n=1 Tax=Aspergillus cavernicola TaxID=176166 RepID=A0ABR4IGY0_9EURO